MPETDTISADFASTSLACTAEIPVPQADVFAGRFPLTANPSPLAEDERAVVLRSLHSGNAFANHMAHAHWRQGEGWDDYGVIPYDSLSLSPAAAVLHYGQEVFEGIRAYWREDGSVWIFRPRYNAAYLNAPVRRMTLPELAEKDFMAFLVDLVHAGAIWVPSGEGESLYLRPFAFASETFLGMRPAAAVGYYVITSPIGPYFPHSLELVSTWVTTEYHHTERGGTGTAKTGGNYVSSLPPQQETYVQDCGQVCFLDDVLQKDIEKFGDMSLMVVDVDGIVRTPHLAGTILEGCARNAAIHLLRDPGRNVVEEIISLQGLLAGIESGQVSEVFACRTAVVVVPLGHLKGEGLDARIEGSKVTRQIHDQLTAIQTGRAKDPYGWMYQLMPPRS